MGSLKGLKNITDKLLPVCLAQNEFPLDNIYWIILEKTERFLSQLFIFSGTQLNHNGRVNFFCFGGINASLGIWPLLYSKL